MKKKQVKKFLGILMASAMFFTTTVSPMAADIDAFSDEIQITQENEEEPEQNPSEEQVDIEESVSDEDESLAIVSDDSEENESTAVFSDEDTLSNNLENTDETKRTEEEALSALYAAFSNYKSASPLAFPYGTGEGKYTNALTFLQDKIQEIVPKSEYEVSFNYTSAMPGTSGKETTMDTTTLDIAPVHAADITKPGFIGVTFSIGDKVSTKITQLYLAVDPIEMTPQEAVDFEAGLVNFDTIKGMNTSQEQIVSKIGKTSGSTVGALPTAAEIYKSGNNTVVASWAVEHVSGSENCLTLDAKGTTTTVVRPNVGKEDGHYKLKATYANKTDPTINRTVTYDLTVPAFEGVVLPVRVTPSDATLTVTDKYYNTQVGEEYISSVEDGLYNYTLHAGAAGGSQSFS